MTTGILQNEIGERRQARKVSLAGTHFERSALFLLETD